MSQVIDCIGQEVFPGDVLMVPSKRHRAFELMFVEKFTADSVVGFDELDRRVYFGREKANEKCMKLNLTQVKTHLVTVPSQFTVDGYAVINGKYQRRITTHDRYVQLKKKLGL